MSQPSEPNPEANQSSHDDSETSSKSETKSEGGSTPPEHDVFLSIWYPSPPFFPTPYLCTWDFLNAKKAIQYKMKHFNQKTIHQGLILYPNLPLNPIYYSTYIKPDSFLPLQCHIQNSIDQWNAHVQIC